ncbi:hypothetical protein R1sor_002024 [Riccia sorocarpa]|uniref:Uncharacterized protein n=1 Tax=Riccia sorocarpa TaxID=122646 RepID=A0ABD3GXL0_9MARC
MVLQLGCNFSVPLPNHVLLLNQFLHQVASVSGFIQLPPDQVSVLKDLCNLALLDINKDGWTTFCEEVSVQPEGTDTPDLEYFYDSDGSYSSLSLEAVRSVLVTDACFIVALCIWTQGEPEAEPEGEPEADPEGEPEAEPEGGPEADSEGDSEGEPEAEPEGEKVSDEGPRFISHIMEIFSRGSLASNPIQLCFDICWLCECQIPLFLVKNLWTRVQSVVGLADYDLALRGILNSATSACGLILRELDADEFDPCDHLLACLYKMITSKQKGEDEEEDEEEDEDEENGAEEPQKEENFKSYILGRVAIAIGRQILEFLEKWATYMRTVLIHPPQYESRKSLPSARLLAKTGIRFQGATRYLSEVRFVKSFSRLSATLYLPAVSVGDYTERALLNMSIYESLNALDEGVHCYASLMDELIDTEEDVQLLMEGKNPAIESNVLGADKRVVEFFTNPLQNSGFASGPCWDRFEDVRDEMIEWYNNPWRRQWVEFVDRFRLQPWLLVSLLAATFLLILTVLQTIYTIWGFYKA